jgi:hypothetical protein
MNGEHSLPYAFGQGSSWRVAVPITGRLSPLVYEERFSSRYDAETWINSNNGIEIIASLRSEKSRGKIAKMTAHPDQVVE